jgi:hypothetical protein
MARVNAEMHHKWLAFRARHPRGTRAKFVRDEIYRLMLELGAQLRPDLSPARRTRLARHLADQSLRDAAGEADRPDAALVQLLRAGQISGLLPEPTRRALVAQRVMERRHWIVPLLSEAYGRVLRDIAVALGDDAARLGPDVWEIARGGPHGTWPVLAVNKTALPPRRLAAVLEGAGAVGTRTASLLEQPDKDILIMPSEVSDGMLQRFEDWLFDDVERN